MVVFANGSHIVGEQFLGQVAKNLESIQAEVGKNIQDIQSGVQANLKGMQRGFDEGIHRLGQNVQSKVHAVQVNGEKAIKGLQRGAGQVFEDLFKPIPAPARVKTVSIPAKVVAPAPAAAGESVEKVVNQHVVNAFLFGNAANEATSPADWYEWAASKSRCRANQDDFFVVEEEEEEEERVDFACRPKSYHALIKSRISR